MAVLSNRTLEPLEHWDRGLESHLGHGYMLFLVLFVQSYAERALRWDDPTEKELYHMPRNGLCEGQSVNR
jgi:hypothetical protein